MKIETFSVGGIRRKLGAPEDDASLIQIRIER